MKTLQLKTTVQHLANLSQITTDGLYTMTCSDAPTEYKLSNGTSYLFRFEGEGHMFNMFYYIYDKGATTKAGNPVKPPFTNKVLADMVSSNIGEEVDVMEIIGKEYKLDIKVSEYNDNSQTTCVRGYGDNDSEAKKAKLQRVIESYQA